VQAAIEARAVTCRTRAGEVTVRDISLTVGQGELVAIIGGGGSGKATLLDALSGRRPPASGTVRRCPEGQAGYVTVGDSVHPVLPLDRALRYGVALRGLGRDGGPVAGAIGLVGLTARAGATVGQLSPGERKRSAIAAELLAAPATLFLDDPTAALDAAEATQVLRLLRRLCNRGMTVLLTTTSPFNADRCDKVAVLATGGHLAFFGTPAAARGYFGADSMDEIYERLAGLDDTAAAWPRRFFYFTRTASGAAPVPTLPRAPGPALLVPDLAGPHSAGRPSLSLPDDDFPEVRPDLARDPLSEGQRDHGAGLALAAGTVPAQGQAPDLEDDSRPARPPRPSEQFPLLLRREAEVLARARRRRSVLVAVPAAIAALFCVLLVVGALDGRATVTLAWAILSGLVTGVAYALPLRTAESGVLRRERFAGLSIPAFITAKAALLVPAVAAADAIILAVPAIASRLQAGFGLSYLAVFLASLAGLAAAVAVAARSSDVRAISHRNQWWPW
jgi:ABC-type multidrug transport system ATPase subunit